VRVAVIGCGLIGARRARVASEAGDEVSLVADVDPGRAAETSAATQSRWTTEWRDVVADPSVDAAIVATPNRDAVEITTGLLAAGKHVLCEKPLGRNAEEAARSVAAARANNRVLKVGFNHRHHPAIARAHELASGGAIGPLLGIRAAYGHGGRPGYDREWRGDPELAGGGELLDQGVHVVDLCRWFLGDFDRVLAVVATWYWSIAPLEDNAFALLCAPGGEVASLHTSWTQWKNLFRFEVIGRDGYVIVDGLGGSYGPERLTLGIRTGDGAVPDEEAWSYPGGDVSWREEWREFTAAVAEAREPIGSGADGLAAAHVIDALYASSRSGTAVPVPRPAGRGAEGAA
jgi:predicted dehydrogenase